MIWGVQTHIETQGVKQWAKCERAEQEAECEGWYRIQQKQVNFWGCSSLTRKQTKRGSTVFVRMKIESMWAKKSFNNFLITVIFMFNPQEKSHCSICASAYLCQNIYINSKVHSSRASRLFVLTPENVTTGRYKGFHLTATVQVPVFIVSGYIVYSPASDNGCGPVRHMVAGLGKHACMDWDEVKQ